MELIDNINRLLGDDLKQTIQPGARLKVAASCFSMYAFEALKAELENVDELNFVFTSSTFVASQVTDKIRKERREFHIPRLDRERSLYGSEFEIQLRNKLTQRAVARECADWIRRKATFKSNRTKAPMQQYACVQAGSADTAYMPLHGFTAVDLGYQQGNAASNLVNKMDEAPFAATYLSLFDQIWNDPEKLEDVTEQICEHIASVYQENSPESIYFLMLYNIFNEFLDDIDEDVLPNTRLKELFVKQVEQIVWAFKLAPEMLHLPERPGVPEIQVFSIQLKAPELNQDVLGGIDRAITFPIVFELALEGKNAGNSRLQAPQRSRRQPLGAFRLLCIGVVSGWLRAHRYAHCPASGWAVRTAALPANPFASAVTGNAG